MLWTIPQSCSTIIWTVLRHHVNLDFRSIAFKCYFVLTPHQQSIVHVKPSRIAANFDTCFLTLQLLQCLASKEAQLICKTVKLLAHNYSYHLLVAKTTQTIVYYFFLKRHKQYYLADINEQFATVATFRPIISQFVSVHRFRYPTGLLLQKCFNPPNNWPGTM